MTEKKKMTIETISPIELNRWNKLKTSSLHYYQLLFQKIVVGREADLEFFKTQSEIITDFTFDERYKKSVLWQIMFFKERLEVVNRELDKRCVNKMHTSIN